MSRMNGGSVELRSRWPDAGTPELEQELEAALGPMDAYDVVGWPGAALEAPVRRGDILIRIDARRRRPLVARMTSVEIQGPAMLPPGAEAEGDGAGIYAEAYERTPAGWSRAPAYRLVAGPNRVVRPGQIVIRPMAGAVRPPILDAPPARRWAVPPPPPAMAQPAAAPVEEPAQPEPDDPGDDDDREDDTKSKGKKTVIDFGDDGSRITVPVVQVDASVAEQEVEAAINTLGRWMLPFATAYLGALDNFETNMLFASDQETRPRTFEVALKEIAKAIVEEGLKKAFEDMPVIGQVVGVVKSIVVAWQEENERVDKAKGERRIAAYVEDARNQINELVRRMTRAIDDARPQLLADFRAAVASSIKGQGTNRVLTGNAAQFILQLRKAVEQFKSAVPRPERIQQLITEKFMGPPQLTDYVSHGGRQSATLWIHVKVYWDRTASTPWQVKDVDSAWTVPSLSPHPDRLATSLRSAMLAQGKEVWRCNLPKAVRLRIEEEVFGPNPYHDTIVWFHGDPADYSLVWKGNLFDQAWRLPEVRAAVLKVSELEGSER